MMKRVRRPDGKVVSFEYDALGRRTAKLYQGQITRWVWDGNTPLHEWKYAIEDRPETVVDELGLLSKDREERMDNLTTWVFDEGSFRPAAKIIDEERYSIINDHLGIPKEAYDSSGKKAWACELSAYGKVKKCSDSALSRSGSRDNMKILKQDSTTIDLDTTRQRKQCTPPLRILLG
jgi:YD repeat-containing protein